MSNNFVNKIKRNQGAIIHWAIVAGISATIAAVVLLGLGVEKGTYEADTARYEESLMLHGAGIAENDAGIAENDGRLDTIEGLGTLATEDDIIVVTNQTSTNAANISALGGRLTDAECNITDIQDDLACLSGSPPEGYLTGSFNNYTLHAKASGVGNYTADVILLYSTPITVGNTTYDDAVQAFYGSLNTSASLVGHYEPSLVYNGTHWAVRKVTLNIGIFALEAATEKSMVVVFGGLSNTYAPSYAYVYVSPVL